MKALRYMGPYSLRLADVPMPELPADGCLVQIRACGICGSDVHGYTGKTGRRIAPMTMGHEFSGEIVQVGPEVKRFSVGDAVIPQPIQFCGKCRNCRRGLTMLCQDKKFFGVMDVDGAFAEYLSIPERYLYKKPDGVTYPEAAMAEPYAVAYGAVKKAGDLQDKRVLIVGAGTIGLCVLQLVLAQKPELVVVSDLSDARLATAKALGANEIRNPGKCDFLAEIGELTGGEMMDVSFEAVGVQPTANQSVAALTEMGTAVWIGNNAPTITINMQEIVTKAKRVLGTYTYTHQEFGELIELMGSGALNPDRLISRIVPLEQAAECFDALLNHPDDYIKIIVDPSEKEGENQ